MQYLVILGRQPEFGLLELEALFGDQIRALGKIAALTERKLDINQLGGTIKVGRVIYQGPARDLGETPLSLDELPVRDGKTTFGLSYYGVQAGVRYVTAEGLALKKRLRGHGSVRFVAPQDGMVLSAAQVKFNSLLRNGFELLVAVHRGDMAVAITEQVQDIDAYAARDYARPSRSAKVGMLPPKLAQIMVNTTAAPLVCDPFCGTGVVLQEALLLGRKAAGSDLAPAMVASSRENLEWLRRHRPELPEVPVGEADAREVQLPDPPLAVVSEGYLGPHLSHPPTSEKLDSLQKELTSLYAASLRNWAGQIPSGTDVTLTAPVWRTAAGWQPLGIIDRLPDLGYTLRSFQLVDSRNLVYRRPQQVVGRQLILARKQ